MLKRSSYTPHLSQRGSAHIVIVLVLVVAIIGIVGFLYWNKVNASNLITYDEIVDVTGEDDIEDLEGAPETFKTHILDQLEKQNQANKSLAQDEEDACFTTVSVWKIASEKFVIGGVSTDGEAEDCNGGAAKVWALDSSGAWKTVDVAQDYTFSCDKLKKFKVPVTIAGNECYNADLDTIPYKG